MFTTNFRRLALTCLPILALILTVPSCSSGVKTGEVGGKVTFEKAPVSEGRISFRSAKGDGDEALLKSDGTYAIKKPLPVGDYVVTVIPLIEKKQVEGKGPVVGVEKEPPNIPERYRTEGATDLKATVKQGKNDLDFDMKR
jgi:hypothetical protein